MIVPHSFCYSPFYKTENDLNLRKYNSLIESWKDGFFLLDISFVMNVYQDTEPPWENQEESVQLAFQYWNELGKPMIGEYFRKRDRIGAKPHMMQFLAIYIQSMHWGKGVPVTSLDNIATNINSMPFAPMNVSERLQFVLNAPNHHHAFTTLNQLFLESKKKLAVYHSNLRKVNDN